MILKLGISRTEDQVNINQRESDYTESFKQGQRYPFY